MKRKILFILLVCALAAVSWAQGRGWNQDRLTPAETVTVSGSMIVAYGFPAVTSGDITYLVGGINRLVGFVEGLKEGAQVTIEGQAISIRRDGNLKLLRPSKLTLGAKTYDLALPNSIMRNFNQGPMAPGWGPRNFRQPAPPPGRQPPNDRQRRRIL